MISRPAVHASRDITTHLTLHVGIAIGIRIQMNEGQNAWHEGADYQKLNEVPHTACGKIAAGCEAEVPTKEMQCHGVPGASLHCHSNLCRAFIR